MQFHEDLGAGPNLEAAKRLLHQNQNAMFTQTYGSVKTFYNYLETGTLGWGPGQRKVAARPEPLSAVERG